MSEAVFGIVVTILFREGMSESELGYAEGRELDTLTRQRDALVDALQGTLALLEALSHGTEQWIMQDNRFTRGTAALASIEEEKAS